VDAAQLTTLVYANELVVRNALISTNAAVITSAWPSANPWGTGTYPGTSGRACDNTTTGALPLPGGGPGNESTYIFGRGKHDSAAQNNHLTFLDRLVDYGGLSALSAGAQSLGVVAMPARGNNGVGAMLYAEPIVTAASSVATTMTASYTNPAGVPGRTATAIVAAGWATAARVFQFTLQGNDNGVKSVESWNVGSVSPNAGNIGLVIARPVFNIGCSYGIVGSASVPLPYRDIMNTGSGAVATTACLWMIVMASGGSMAATGIHYSLV
jgi:hypothetical protein